jgi:NAD(P)-dependent dehydrogenase (short-subunit alcohol dehydrogenase family)
MTNRFSGKAAIVTGGANGIGRATALRLAREGANVLLADIAADDLDETAAEIGDAARTLVCDVTGDDAPERIVAACAAAFGRLDILINNAGIGGRTRVADASDADWERFMATNLTSVFRLSRAALGVIAAPGGRIVNIASVFGLVGYPGAAAYGVAKAGVVQLTRQMAADYAARGILVNAIAPGVIETQRTARRIAEDAWYKKTMIDPTPLGVGAPDDIAGVVAFLCSDDARFIAGEVIVVDGGWMATRYLPED